LKLARPAIEHPARINRATCPGAVDAPPRLPGPFLPEVQMPKDEKPALAAQIGAAHDRLRQEQGKPPMKDDPDFRKHNQTAFDVTADELRQFIERYEHLAAEKQDISEQQKEVMADAKGRGYDTKVIKKIIAERKRDRNDLAEEQAIMDLYKAALGMT
jgi:uncharacterized protein (UPF0335 family)